MSEGGKDAGRDEEPVRTSWQTMIQKVRRASSLSRTASVSASGGRAYDASRWRRSSPAILTAIPESIYQEEGDVSGTSRNEEKSAESGEKENAPKPAVPNPPPTRSHPARKTPATEAETGGASRPVRGSVHGS